MREVAVERLGKGDRLGKAIFEPDGTLLLSEGVVLTQFHLEALRQRGLSRVYLDDHPTADISRSRPIRAETRNRIAGTLRESFGTLSERLAPLREAALEPAETTDTTGALVSPDFRRNLRKAVDVKYLQPIVNDVDVLLNDLDGDVVYSGLDSLRDHDSYTYQHSVDVTVLGLLLAKKVGWQGSRLRAFGIGLLLHDIGKLFVEPHILTKPGPLEDREFDSIKRHPALGQAMISELMPQLGPLPGIVALQHHERQDGTGYPRGIMGSNKLHAGNPAGVIHDFGAISAVADVYDALASDRPYRSGLAKDEVVRLIINLAGSHLNRDAVEVFRKVVAPFPVCTEVRVCNGPWTGCTGVVCRDNPAEPDRPSVRLLTNPDGRQMEPTEFDLATAPHVRITSELAEPAKGAAA